jgi:hypothetical protein
MKFENTLAVVAKYDKSGWDIGDAIIRDIGEPSIDGRHSGSTAKLAELATAIAEEGYDYKAETLRVFWHVAHKFPPCTRMQGATWAVHRLAQTPEMLDVVLKSARLHDGQRLTVRSAEAILQAIQEREHAEARLQHAASGNPQAPPKQTVPPKNTSPVNQSAIDRMTALHEVMALFARARDARKQVLPLLEKHLPDFPPEAHDAIVEEALAAAEEWRTLLQAAGLTQPTRRGHLSVVEEGAQWH